MTARPTISGSSAPQLLPDPLSEAHGDLSLTEAANFLRILDSGKKVLMSFSRSSGKRTV